MSNASAASPSAAALLAAFHRIADAVPETRRKPLPVSTVRSVLSGLCQRRLWQAAVVWLSCVKQRGTPIQEPWLHQVMSAASTATARADALKRIQQLFAFAPSGTSPRGGLAPSSSRAAAPSSFAASADGTGAQRSSDLSRRTGHRAGEIATSSNVSAPLEGGAALPLRVLRGSAAARIVNAPAELERFFLAQSVVRDADEVAQLISALQRPLPPVIRLSHGTPWRDLAIRVLEDSHRQGVADPLPWYPARLAWRLRTQEMSSDPQGADTLDSVRGSKAGARHWFGVLSRGGVAGFQSASSLLPPLALQADASHLCLDLCASPGNKARELLDVMHLPRRSTSSTGGAPKSQGGGGAVVVNDMDENGRRGAALLSNLSVVPRGSASRRHDDAVWSQSQCDTAASAIVTRHDGRTFPLDGVLFDRVMVDAPCSGDGLVHKQAQRDTHWPGWHPRKSLDHHSIQVALLRRALSLTRPGGIVVYSTCTLSPIENEAVVADAVVNGWAELLPTSAALTTAFRAEGAGLAGEVPTFTPGLLRWMVPAAACTAARNDWSALAASDVRWRHYLPNDALPGRSENSLLVSAANAAALRSELTKTIRVLPHRNIGMSAFFVAVLRRTATMGPISNTSTTWRMDRAVRRCGGTTEEAQTRDAARAAAVVASIAERFGLQRRSEQFEYALEDMAQHSTDNSTERERPWEEHLAATPATEADVASRRRQHSGVSRPPARRECQWLVARSTRTMQALRQAEERQCPVLGSGVVVAKILADDTPTSSWLLSAAGVQHFCLRPAREGIHLAASRNVLHAPLAAAAALLAAAASGDNRVASDRVDDDVRCTLVIAPGRPSAGQRPAGLAALELASRSPDWHRELRSLSAGPLLLCFSDPSKAALPTSGGPSAVSMKRLPPRTEGNFLLVLFATWHPPAPPVGLLDGSGTVTVLLPPGQRQMLQSLLGNVLGSHLRAAAACPSSGLPSGTPL